MSRDAVKGSWKAAGIVSVFVLILAASPAWAQTQNHRSFTLAERQLLLIERMTNSALLAALGIDAAPQLRSIHWSRNRFKRMQRDLRRGDPNVGLSPTKEPEILEALGRADMEWQEYDSIFAEIVDSRRVSQAQIRALSESHATTAEALRKMAASYRYFVYGGRHHSILSSTINGTGQLRASTQLMLRCLMMTAYSEYSKEERQKLAQATKEFAQKIDGLIHGNHELGLLPAATREIKDELEKVHKMWKKVQPILAKASAGKAVTKKQIATVAQYANDMAVPLTLALIMYMSV